MDMKENKQEIETVLKHQLEEWRLLNDYIKGKQRCFKIYINADSVCNYCGAGICLLSV